jgi:thiol-disulfide isomerase/thioredoxin
VKKFVSSLATLMFAAVSLVAADNSALRKAPELAFTIPGQGQKLLSQYRGKVVALEFIFTTCPHCQAASKVMTRFQQEYGPKGLQVIDVAVNDNADLLVENFVKDYHVGFPVGYVPSAQMLSFMGWKDGRYVVPQLVMIDREGYIHYQTPPTENDEWDKLMKEDAVKAHIEELLAPMNASKHSAGSKVASARKPS